MDRPDTRKPQIGARPGTLVIDPGASRPVLRAFTYDAESLEEHHPETVEDVRALAASSKNLWVDVQGLGDEALLRGLAEIFSIHPLALEDVVHVPIRPKAEAYRHNLLMVTRMLRSDVLEAADIEQVSLFLGDGYVLTFQEKPGDVFDPVRQRMAIPTSRIRNMSVDYLAYAIVDTIIDAYFPAVESISEVIDDLEEQVLSHPSEDTLRELNQVKGRLMLLKRSVAPHREALNALIRDENELIGQSVRIYLRDTYDHIVQTSEALESSRELVNGLMNTYLSVISNRTNDVMKVLTIVASIFVPLTFLAGIYGMNFQHMPELGQRWAYPALLTVMAVVAGGMVVYFQRKGWLSGR